MAIIDQKNIQVNDNNRFTYLNFLSAARAAQDNPDGLSLKLGWYAMSDKARYKANCSLCIIFYFYAKTTPIHAKTSKGDTYESIESARHALSFFELLILLRDFRVIPNIIIKEELHYLWHLNMVEKAKKGQKFRRMICFDEFKAFLGRIAILAFNKPGMKRIMQASGSGRTFNSGELVGFLARFMHLDDVQWVRNRIRTTGKETVGLINFKAGGEKNFKNFQNLRDDLRGLRLARIMNSTELNEGPEWEAPDSLIGRELNGGSTSSTTTPVIAQSTATMERVTENVSKILAMAEQEEKKFHSGHDNKTNYEKSFAKTARFVADTAGRKETKGAFFGLETISEATREGSLGGESHSQSPVPSHSLWPSEESHHESAALFEGSTASHSVMSAFDVAMQQFQHDTELTLDGLQTFLDLYNEDSARDYQSESQQAPSTSPRPQTTSSGAEGRSQGVPIKRGIVISAGQVQAVKDFDAISDASSTFLDRFSDSKAYFQNKSYSDSSFKESNSSTSGYLDMGALALGTKVIIRLTITNETAHALKVDIRTRGLNENVSPNITSLPRMVAAGLSFFAYIAFTVEAPAKSKSNTSLRSVNVLGSVTLESFWPSQPTETITSSYPIFFRTLPEANPSNQVKLVQLEAETLTQYPPCGPASLDELLAGASYCGQTPSASAASSTSNLTPTIRGNNQMSMYIDHFPLAATSPRRRSSAVPTSAPPTQHISSTTSEAVRHPSAPAAPKSSSAATVSAITKRRFSMSSKVIMTHRKKTPNTPATLHEGDYIGL
eukprot:CAMPEP_0114427970 /NCGR_PEP_ID=MMETSP0103-20121206/8666_1 /TAXON_ID=37642 ORGANISM="Paraphysomonas imperforata, Strain PA2" /NCGR_SAMPLE_ID=MMETSP0103 /ASSEMBLY_ACC=CAM_ASM_000201 /LENGTH=779 /DNA_ID=CAMNT_0001597135 /DNA_START=306 /DNA_END=2645 /DNA_ORIENTATION=+